MGAAANCGEDDEWELINDDGFVYKRKKRPRLNPSLPSSSSSVPPTPPDRELERKKTTLLKIRGHYDREILQWEHLSNTLSSMQQESSIPQLPELPVIQATTTSPPGHPSNIYFPTELLSDITTRQLTDELLLQVEAEEAIIEDIVNLCEMAEAISREKERQSKLVFAALPVWSSSPRALISSLCDD